MEKLKSIELPESLYRRIEGKLAGSNFKSVSEYVSFVLRERLISEEEGPRSTFSKEDEEKVKTRLRDLGYL